MPVNTFNSVDLPLPFSPTSPMICPIGKEKDTSCRIGFSYNEKKHSITVAFISPHDLFCKTTSISSFENPSASMEVKNDLLIVFSFLRVKAQFAFLQL